jgi:hypothetical protein
MTFYLNPRFISTFMTKKAFLVFFWMSTTMPHIFERGLHLFKEKHFCEEVLRTQISPGHMRGEYGVLSSVLFIY